MYFSNITIIKQIYVLIKRMKTTEHSKKQFCFHNIQEKLNWVPTIYQELSSIAWAHKREDSLPTSNDRSTRGAIN